MKRLITRFNRCNFRAVLHHHCKLKTATINQVEEPVIQVKLPECKEPEFIQNVKSTVPTDDGYATQDGTSTPVFVTQMTFFLESCFTPDISMESQERKEKRQQEFELADKYLNFP